MGAPSLQDGINEAGSIHLIRLGHRRAIHEGRAGLTRPAIAEEPRDGNLQGMLRYSWADAMRRHEARIGGAVSRDIRIGAAARVAIEEPLRWIVGIRFW